MAFLAVRAIRGGITGAVHAYQDGKNPDGPQPHLNRRGKPQRGLLYSGMYGLVSAVDQHGKGKGKATPVQLDPDHRTVSPSESPNPKAPYAVPPNGDASTYSHRDGNLQDPFDEEHEHDEEEEEEQKRLASGTSDAPPPYPGPPQSSSRSLGSTPSPSATPPALPPRNPSPPASYPHEVNAYPVNGGYNNYRTYGPGGIGGPRGYGYYDSRPHGRLNRRDRRDLALLERQAALDQRQAMAYGGRY